MSECGKSVSNLIKSYTNGTSCSQPQELWLCDLRPTDLALLQAVSNLIKSYTNGTSCSQPQELCDLRPTLGTDCGTSSMISARYRMHVKVHPSTLTTRVVYVRMWKSG